ncbi:hypothetical protein QFW77_07740 [Luteimonas sp. RD2P54]|uniref:DUF1311 domain-containing protein n=1 Tax=Luteimonas endophytica TaxID=3042023 RepID=A0ABT6J7S9_9GAMM|nr:hypothetical protein [Luteimonas endophytica]MDH5822884.1 hypothetical protein [Luteimonas endophytica]
MNSPNAQLRARPSRLAAAMLACALLSPAASFAAPPATVATCDGIKEAYQVLGAQCTAAYGRIAHAPANAQQRLQSYRARIAVLEIFRKALLCNGMYGATADAQRRFASGEPGHLQAIANLHLAMTNAGDPIVPPLYTAGDLGDVSVTKQQCK